MDYSQIASISSLKMVRAFMVRARVGAGSVNGVSYTIRTSLVETSSRRVVIISIGSFLVVRGDFSGLVK